MAGLRLCTLFLRLALSPALLPAHIKKSLSNIWVRCVRLIKGHCALTILLDKLSMLRTVPPRYAES